MIALTDRLWIGTLFRAFWGQIVVTWGLTLLETAMFALLPLLIGRSIDGLLGSAWDAFTFLLIGVAITTMAWLTVAYTTKPTDDAILFSFCQKVRPGGPGWAKVAQRARAQGIDLGTPEGAGFPYALAGIALGSLGIYAVLFATGFFLYGRAWVDSSASSRLPPG